MERIDKQHRYPWEVIELAVGWYQKDQLTFRAVSDKLSAHGVTVSHKTVFEWVQKFGPTVEKKAKKKSVKSESDYEISENYVKVNGEWKYMYGAVDKGGSTFNAVFRSRKNLASAKAFLKKVLEQN
jgi:transposase-like protein